MSYSRVVLVVLLLSMISMHGIRARGLGVELEPEKVGKGLKKEDKVLATIKQLVSSVVMTLLKRQEHEDGSSSAGIGSIITSSHQATKWKAMRRQARSVNKHHGREEAKGAFDSADENGVGEDVVVMDYALPHRKPPIHNEKS